MLNFQEGFLLALCLLALGSCAMTEGAKETLTPKTSLMLW